MPSKTDLFSPSAEHRTSKPNSTAKLEFARNLQQLLFTRNWNQSDLARAVERTTGRKIGRDAISTYINARSFPSHSTIRDLCQALGVTREELLPIACVNAGRAVKPNFEIRTYADQPGRAWVSIDREMSLETAHKMTMLLIEEDAI